MATQLSRDLKMAPRTRQTRREIPAVRGHAREQQSGEPQGPKPPQQARFSGAEGRHTVFGDRQMMSCDIRLQSWWAWKRLLLKIRWNEWLRSKSRAAKTGQTKPEMFRRRRGIIIPHHVPRVTFESQSDAAESQSGDVVAWTYRTNAASSPDVK
jgi:hypothetical protein